MVFQVWLEATGTTVATSSMKVSTVISGRLRQAVRSLGTVSCSVVGLKSIGTAAASGTVFQFVAFGIKKRGLVGGLTF